MMSEPTPGGYLVGVVTCDITPAVGTPLAGFGARGWHASTGLYHPLRAVVVAVDDGSTPVLLVSAELIGFYDRAARVREAIAARTPIPEERIVVSGTHTHAGPALRERDKATHGWIDESHVDRVVETISQAAARAWRTRYPAALDAGVGRSGLAMSRRLPDPNQSGAVRMAPNPDGTTDHDVPVLTVTGDGVIRAVLASYGCHPTSRTTQKIGGDYVSYLYEDLEDAFPHAQPAFFQGCAGDQKVRPATPGAADFGNRTLAEVRQAGAALATAVTDVVAHRQLGRITGAIKTARSVIELRTEPLTDHALQDALAPDQPAFRQRWARRHLDAVDRNEQPAETVPFEIQTVTFGTSLAVIAMSGEMTVEHGLRLKRDHAECFDHVVPLGYANDIVGYVPVKRQFDEYGYEVLDANQYHGRTGRYLPDTEDRIHAEVQRMLGG